MFPKIALYVSNISFLNMLKYVIYQHLIMTQFSFHTCKSHINIILRFVYKKSNCDLLGWKIGARLCYKKQTDKRRKHILTLIDNVHCADKLLALLSCENECFTFKDSTQCLYWNACLCETQ